MRRYKIWSVLALLLAMLSLQSCLKEQSDTFDKASSIRLQEYMDKAQTTLVNAPHGWLFEIFPDNTQKYGGFAFTVKFDQQQAEVRSILSPGVVATSYYKMTAEQGPAITFDTYNELMHRFSDPSSEKYQADRGDFEFVVDSISDDLIPVHGYRTKNTMFLRKLTKPAEEYLADVKTFTADFINATMWAFKGQVNGVEIQGEISPSSRKIVISVGGRQVQEAVVFTDKGVRLYVPISVNGMPLYEFEFDKTTLNYVAKDFYGHSVALQGERPAWYRTFKAHEGTYDLTMTAYVGDASGNYTTSDVTTEVQLVAGSDNNSYLIKGLNDGYDVKLAYDRAKDRLSLNYQVLTTLPNGHTIRMLPWDTQKGYITWTEGVGLSLLWNKNTQTYSFADNGVWKLNGDNLVHGFILYDYDNSGTRLGAAEQPSFYPYIFKGNIPYITKMKTLKKKS